ncbi:MAG: DNA repair and recombination protein RadB [Candidatus Pacearchaeota archaeon]|nr:DNA repair and recombination protein RadB [Candidatus Pacearchaeota archaeon]
MIEKISSGSFDFNKFLDGGYERDVISMVAGPPGSGKTNLSVLVACSQAKKGNRVIFVDTEGGFSVERVKQIVGDGYERILEKILILNPTSFEEQKKAFVTLLENVRAGHVDLIVVDGMAMLYRLELGDAVQSKEDEKIKLINRSVAKQMRVLAEISRKQKIPVVITNQVYSGFVSEDEWRKGVRGETNIVGGDLFKYWSKCIIELKQEGSKRRMILLKHRSLPNKEMNFEIKNEGVFRKGLF